MTQGWYAKQPDGTYKEVHFIEFYSKDEADQKLAGFNMKCLNISDWNQALTNGFYMSEPGAINTPDSNYYYYGYVIATESSETIQYVFSNSRKQYTRYQRTDKGWKPWFDITVSTNATQLITNNKTTITDAVNEVKTDSINNSNKIGDLTTLKTTNKTSMVEAINELLNKQTINTNVATNSLNTMNQKVGDKDSLITTNKNSLVEAINEIMQNLNNASVSVGANLNNLYTSINKINEDIAIIKQQLQI